MNTYLGEIAAIITSLCFSITSTLFTLAGQKVGSVVVNRTRLGIAVVFIIGAHFLLRIPLPSEIETERLIWLSLSGIIGLVLGDSALFQAFILIGPRISMLLMGLTPVLAAILAWIFLGEQLSELQIIGIGLTLGGVLWVIIEHNREINSNGIEKKNYLPGILYGLGGAAGQALGLITAKKGLGGDFPAISGTLIRMFTAAIVLWSFTILRGQAWKTVKNLNINRSSLGYITVGSFTGPFLGVTFSLIAIQNTSVGVASTLMALTPIFLLPISHLIFHERFGWGAINGTIIAVVGVGILFLV